MHVYLKKKKKKKRNKQVIPNLLVWWNTETVSGCVSRHVQVFHEKDISEHWAAVGEVESYFSFFYLKWQCTFISVNVPALASRLIFNCSSFGEMFWNQQRQQNLNRESEKTFVYVDEASSWCF